MNKKNDQRYTQDKLEEVISRSETRKLVAMPSSDQILELISYRTLNKDDIPAIRNFQRKVAEDFNINLLVVGGGYGCTKIAFHLENASPEEVRILIQDLLESEMFRKAALKVDFELAIVRNPDARIVLKNGKNESLSNNQGVLLFCSYARADEDYKESLDNHLAALKKQGFVQVWHDRLIPAGEQWKDTIDEKLDEAAVILLLISSDFMASEYCYGKEMTRALERHDLREAKVVPIIVRPVDWQSAPFAKLQAIPKDGKAITIWDNEDEAWTSVAKEIRRSILGIYKSKGAYRTARSNLK